MIHIAEKKLFDNIPGKLTAKVMRKHCSQYVACQAGNMAQKPVPQSITTTEYVPDEVLQVDIKVLSDTSEARKHLRAFGNHVGAMTAFDMATGYKFDTLIKSHSSLEL